jgi:hypothetical protein
MFWKPNLSDNSRKRGCHSFHDPGRLKISAKKIAETLAISRSRVGYIIHEISDIEKLSAKWVLNCLNAVHKRDQVLASQAILD